MKVQKETVDLAKLFLIVKNRIVLILILSGLGLFLSGIITFRFITPMYQVKTQLLVHSSSSENMQATAQEIQGNVQLINTYNEVLVSPVVLNQVISRLKINETASELQKQIKLSTETDSQVITMTVKDRDKFKAKDIANTTVDIFKTEISKIMNVDNVAVLAPAIVNVNAGPVSPNKKVNLFLGFLIGFVVGFVIAFLLDFLDKTIKDAQDVEEITGLPILGEIPRITSVGLEKNEN